MNSPVTNNNTFATWYRIGKKVMQFASEEDAIEYAQDETFETVLQKEVAKLHKTE